MKWECSSTGNCLGTSASHCPTVLCVWREGKADLHLNVHVVGHAITLEECTAVVMKLADNGHSLLVSVQAAQGPEEGNSGDHRITRSSFLAHVEAPGGYRLPFRSSVPHT